MSNIHFEQYVKYEGPNLEIKEFCDEELKNASFFFSLKVNKSPGYDGISSNVIKSVSEKIFGILKTRVKSFNLSRKHEDCVCYSNF